MGYQMPAWDVSRDRREHGLDGSGVTLLIVIGLFMFVVIGGIAMISCHYTLDGIKSKTVGDGQHGTARFATKQEIQKTFTHVEYLPKEWRRGSELPKAQGLIVGGIFKGGRVKALVDTDDVHTLMIGSAGVGKTAYFLYPNIEYACASGMSFLTTDTKGDLFRNYAGIAKKYYGYEVSVIDLRNPTRSDGNNLLHLVNQYMDQYQEDHANLAAKAKAEKYAKITSKTIINSSGGDSASYGQNAFFYDAAEGLLTAVILLIAEYCPPEKRYIISVFKLIQDLLAPSGVKGKNQFQLLMDKLPSDHKARWFAGSALNTADQAMASLIVQQLYRELLAVADEQGGKLKNRVMFYLDEIGTIPKIESLEMAFSAVRSRRCSIVAIIQSFAQLQKNYGKEGSEIIIDNCQDSVFGGFAPNSESAEVLSKHMGNRTVLSGNISRGRNDPSQSLQMISRPLMTSDEIKTLKKGTFIVTKTGAHPMQATLKLFLKWGITFEEPYELQERAARKVSYADKQELEMEIMNRQLAVDLLPPEDVCESERIVPEVMSLRKEHARPGIIGGKLPVRVD